MPLNKIQFQSGLSMPEFIQQYGTEAQCEEALVMAQWSKGFRCPNATMMAIVYDTPKNALHSSVTHVTSRLL